MATELERIVTLLDAFPDALPGGLSGAQIGKILDIGPGTLYPALMRLEIDRKVVSEWAQEPYPRRRLYRICRDAQKADKITRLRISMEGDQFMVDDPSLTGSPPVGRGKTMIEAIGSFVHNNQDRFGFIFDVDPSAEHAEEERRERELARR